MATSIGRRNKSIRNGKENILIVLKLTSLRKKFILVTSLLLLFVFVGKGIVEIKSSISRSTKSLTDEAIAFSRLSTKPLGEAYDLYFESGYYKFREIFEKILELDKDIKRVQFIDVNGRIILDSANLGEEAYLFQYDTVVSQDVIDKVVSNEPIYVRNPKNTHEIIEIFAPYFTDWGSHPYTIRYFVSYEKIAGIVLTIILQSLFLVFLFLILAIGLVGGTVNKLILIPISLVSKAALRISQGRYGERIKIKTNDEIEQMAKAVNKMAQKLERDIIELKELDKLKDEFTDIAANNLKIPLNHLKLNISYLLKHLKNKISKKEFEILKDAERSYHELQLLGDELINITTIKKGKIQTEFFLPLDLSKIIKEVIDEMREAIFKKGLSLQLHLIKSAPIYGDNLRIRQVFRNLIDNAIKYTEKGKVIVRLKAKNKYYIVEVQDTGVGMEKKEVARLFQKFYRAPSSAKYNEQGTGLGLYLCKLIVELHHGKIWAESKAGKGSKFFVALLKKRGLLKETPLV